jgi:hypothetical protein
VKRSLLAKPRLRPTRCRVFIALGVLEKGKCNTARLKSFLSVDAFDAVLLAWCALVDELGLKASGFDDVALFGQFTADGQLSAFPPGRTSPLAGGR